MNVQRKKLSQLRQMFVSELTDVYDGQEIESLFVLVSEFVLGLNRIEIRMKVDEIIEESIVQKIVDILMQLRKKIPIQYVLGEADFYDLKLNVNQSVLIPRPETEELVRWVLDTIKSANMARPRIIDIGTGSGCIPIALSANIADAKVFGVDVSEGALTVAEENKKRNNSVVNFLFLDILKDDLTDFERLDVVVSNPPYVLASEKELMHANVLDNEPHLALFVEDSDPLVFYSRIATVAMECLVNGGYLFFEINERYGNETVNLLHSVGYKSIELRKDINGRNRMIRCVK